MSDALNTYLIVLMSALLGCTLIAAGAALVKFSTFFGRLSVIQKAFFALVLLAGFWLRFSYFPQSIQVFYDEYGFYNTARMIADDGKVQMCAGGTLENCEETETPFQLPGYPFAVAAAMKATDSRSPETAFRLNAVLGTFAILLVFTLVMAGSGNPVAAIFSALLAAFLPLGLYLSGCGSYEMLSFTVVCTFFIFLILFLKERTILHGVLLFVTAAEALMLREENLLLVPFAVAVLAAGRPGLKAVILSAVSAAALAAVLLPVYPILADHLNVYNRYVGLHAGENRLLIAAQNVKFFCSNEKIPFPFILLALLGSARGRGEKRFSFIMAAFAVAMFVFWNAIRMEFWHADFPRRAFTMLLPVLVLGGFGMEKLLSGIESGLLRALLFLALLGSFAAAAAGTAANPMNPRLAEQDKMMRMYISQTDPECSFFSIYPSITMAVVPNRSYHYRKLFDKNFLEEHKECRLLLLDSELASPRFSGDLDFLLRGFFFYPIHQVSLVRDKVEIIQLKEGSSFGK